jgi:hypothetical protein
MTSFCCPARPGTRSTSTTARAKMTPAPALESNRPERSCFNPIENAFAKQPSALPMACGSPLAALSTPSPKPNAPTASAPAATNQTDGIWLAQSHIRGRLAKWSLLFPGSGETRSRIFAYVRSGAQCQGITPPSHGIPPPACDPPTTHIPHPLHTLSHGRCLRWAGHRPAASAGFIKARIPRAGSDHRRCHRPWRPELHLLTRLPRHGRKR